MMRHYCWILKSLNFGGFKDSANASYPFNNMIRILNCIKARLRQKVLVITIVVGMFVLVALLGMLLYYNVDRKRTLTRAAKNSLILCDSPVSFSYRDHQNATNNFSQLLGSGLNQESAFSNFITSLSIYSKDRFKSYYVFMMAGRFGTVYKGRVAGETLVAVKRLDREFSHGEREFITEVNTIGSMHHRNLVRLCGYCSEDSHR